MSNENKHFSIEILDTNKFIKANDVKEVTNPIFFIRNGVPTPDGLLSNDIFGISMEERANIFGYIRLNGTFLHPLVYKIWSRMDNNIRDIAHGTKRYTINSKGEFVQNDDGETGIDFLKKNMDKIKIRKTDSDERNLFINFIMSHKDLLFIDKMIVIPAYYRDVNNSGSSIGVGEINKMYSNFGTGGKNNGHRHRARPCVRSCAVLPAADRRAKRGRRQAEDRPHDRAVFLSACSLAALRFFCAGAASSLCADHRCHSDRRRAHLFLALYKK